MKLPWRDSWGLAQDRMLRVLNSGWPLLLAVCVSLVFFHSPGTSDVATWLDKKWLPRAERFGPIEGYTRTHDNYPPLSYAVVSLVGVVARLASMDVHEVFKAVLLVFLLAATAATYWATRSVLATVAMHSALCVNSMMHGYLDVLFAPFAILSFHWLRAGRLLGAALAFCVAALMKYQPLIIAPFLVLQLASSVAATRTRMLQAKRLLWQVVVPVTLAVGSMRLLFGPWTFDSLTAATTRHQQLSANALNLNWLWASAINPANPLRVHLDASWGWERFLPRLLFAGGYLYAVWGYLRSRRDVSSCLVYALLGYIAYFVFNHGVHENHLYLGALLAVLLAGWDPRLLFLGYWAVAAAVNELLFYGFSGDGFPYERTLLGVDMTIPFAAANVLMFVVSACAVQRLFSVRPQESSPTRTAPGEVAPAPDAPTEGGGAAP